MHNYYAARRPHTLALENEIQVMLWKNELSGQISDGAWENCTNSDWEVWCSAQVIVCPMNVGRDFSVRKDNFAFTRVPGFLDIIGDRMVDLVREKTGNQEFSFKDLLRELRGIKRCIKTFRIVPERSV